MYSLGIIFFEMNVPLRTAMERDKAIRLIREKDHSLPIILETPAQAVQGSIILSLVSHKPSERPSSTELLQSGKIPVKIEDETIRRALEGLSDPTSPYYHQMMNALFSQTVSKQIKDFAWDLGATTGMHDANEGMLLMRNLVKEHLVSIFQRHGAVETQRQQLLPRSAHYTTNNVVKLLDASGALVQLPYDLILPHARAIARKYPATDRSFAFGNVFREAGMGGEPQTSGEVDFDIVSRDALDLALKEAEVIKVLDEIIDEFPGVANVPMCFHLNHADLLELIMDFCRISLPQRQAVKEQISKLNISDFDWSKIRNELRSPALAVPSTSLDDMAKFNFRDTPEKAITRINTIFENSVYQSKAKACLKHMRDVVSYLKYFGVNHKIFICPLSAINEKFYAGGIMFQCLFDRKKRGVLAAGGRYDRLIEEHKPKLQGMFTGCHAVGFNLSWDKLVVSMDKALNSKTKANSFLKKEKEQNISDAWKARRCDVLVAAFDDAVLRTSGLKVLTELWTNDISAELASNARTLEEIMSKHRDDNHSWIVIIKPDAVAGGRPDLRVRTTATREDADVKAENLVSHLLSELRERDSTHKSRLQRRHPAQQSSEQSHGSSDQRRQNVQVLVAQHRSKKSNKWNIVEAVQSRAQSLLQEYGSAPIAAVETRDEILELIRGARLSDPESWRKVVHSVPLSERDYIQQIQQLLEGFRREWVEDSASGEKSRVAFVSNFRTGHVVLYDLGL
jgi:translation initiation factor 2-alpha kinase 4